MADDIIAIVELYLGLALSSYLQFVVGLFNYPLEVNLAGRDHRFQYEKPGTVARKPKITAFIDINLD
jgi:hypothetical protein